jgi:cytohesin
MPSSVDEIIAASVSGDVKTVLKLLEQDPALASAANMFGTTAVHAANYSGHAEIVQLLREGDRRLLLIDLLPARGAQVNARRRDGMTVLHSAAYRGHLRIIRRLLASGADPTARASDNAGPHAGQTPADTAASQGQMAAAELLRSL